MIQLRDWLVIRFGKENLEKNMKVGKKENRINKNSSKIIQERRMKSLRNKRSIISVAFK